MATLVMLNTHVGVKNNITLLSNTTVLSEFGVSNKCKELDYQKLSTNFLSKCEVSSLDLLSISAYTVNIYRTIIGML